jgi:pyridoxal phosphate enzyme (YggS family)
MTETAASIHERYLKVLERIAAAARRGGHKADSVRVVVVTKTQPIDIVRAAIEAGAKLIGENYAEEGATKIEALYLQSGIEWHMVGHIQSRKASLVAQHFSFVHSLDSLGLAQRLDRAACEARRILPVLLEVNVSGEESKYGLAGWDPKRWAELVPVAEAIAALPNLSLRGLMTMPPLDPDPESARPYFHKLHSVLDLLKRKVAQVEWSELSIGTSTDYEVAVEEGATLVRIGQAILGPRPNVEPA